MADDGTANVELPEIAFDAKLKGGVEGEKVLLLAAIAFTCSCEPENSTCNETTEFRINNR